MLEMRPDCERCGTDLEADTHGAWICSFECTFCESCADEALSRTCPNCGGALLPRPPRPTGKMARFPASTQRHSAVRACTLPTAEMGE